MSDPAVIRTRIVSYLKENVKPGQAVLVTELYNNVFTSPEERDALRRLYDISFKAPAFAAEVYTNTGTIPTLAALSNQFQLKIPGAMGVLLRAIESDPRVPKFFERDETTGESPESMSIESPPTNASVGRSEIIKHKRANVACQKVAARHAI